MFWDKKEKKLPDLPQSKSVARLPSVQNYPSMDDELENEKIHELPTFPDSPMKKGFSQAAIKDAVMTEEKKEEQVHVEQHLPDQPPELPNIPERLANKRNTEDKFRLTEMEEWTPNPKQEETENVMPAKRAAEIKTVFVKIDKFKSARDSLEKVESGLQEIEDLLHHIREVKAKEDQELLSWEKDMENLKSRISGVVSDIFDRTEM